LIDTTLDAGPKPLAGPHPGRLKVDALAQTDADVAAWLTTVDAFHASYNELIAGWLQEFEALRRYIERLEADLQRAPGLSALDVTTIQP
jgi:hypothetical protein